MEASSKPFKIMSARRYASDLLCSLLYWSLVFFWYTHEPKIHRENTSDSWDIPWYTTQKRCITSIYTIEDFTKSSKVKLTCSGNLLKVVT